MYEVMFTNLGRVLFETIDGIDDGTRDKLWEAWEQLDQAIYSMKQPTCKLVDRSWDMACEKCVAPPPFNPAMFALTKLKGGRDIGLFTIDGKPHIVSAFRTEEAVEWFATRAYYCPMCGENLEAGHAS